MATLGIFTVKRVCHCRGEYFTYGGFGEYLEAIRGYFDETVLFARVFDDEPPEGRPRSHKTVQTHPFLP